jgi:hypothetical protein
MLADAEVGSSLLQTNHFELRHASTITVSPRLINAEIIPTRQGRQGLCVEWPH